MTISTRLPLALLAIAACGKSAPPANEPGPAEPAPAAEPAAEAPAPTAEPTADETPAAGAIAQKDVVGSWRTEGTDFEELTIEADGSWSSFLHARPLYSGTWTLEDRSLTLATAQVDEPLVLSEIAATADRLEGTFMSKSVAWTRIADSQ